MKSSVTFKELQLVIDRCMKAQPTLNFALSPDASQLATVFAEMMVFKEDERPLEKFTARQLEAFERWNTE
ncbi:MAG TPA: DUF3717 domain-containing protein [Methylobacter sp.]|jgi:hypothetical protein